MSELAKPLALQLVNYPAIPAQPDRAALENALSGLDWGKLGAERYAAESDSLRKTYNEQQDAYYKALQALRGDGVDPAVTPALLAYTQKLGRLILPGDGSGGNAVFSPANLYLALCMLAETAGGSSRAQLLDLLGLDGVEQARATASALWRTLWNESEGGKTLLANSIWLNERMNFHEETIGTLADQYFASSFRAPMGSKATDAAIAEWINDNTGHLLEEAAGSLETYPDTVMALISTLYFKNQWSEQFSEGGTREDVFTNALGREEKIDFMHRTDSHGRYTAGAGYKMAELAFRDGMSMRFLLPDEGGRRTLSQLLGDADVLTDFLSGDAQESEAKVVWSVPKFDVDSDLDLIPTLKKAGITDVFLPDGADFSPLTDVPSYVSLIEHAARVKVDEEGCEAAAFTVIMTRATAVMPRELPVVEMNLNRPFALLITGADGLPLFLAAVNTTAD